MPLSESLESYFQQLLLLWPENPVLQILLIICLSFILEDPTTIFVGSLLSLGKIDYPVAFVALLLGIFLGDLLLFYLGRGLKKGFFKTKRFAFKKRFVPLSFLFFARFLPGARLITYVSAGFLGRGLKGFLIIVSLSSLIWTYLLLAFTSRLSEYILSLSTTYQGLSIIALILVFWLLELRISSYLKKRNES